MTKPRLFQTLPPDVNELILSKLPLSELLKLRATHQAGMAAVDNYLLKLINIHTVAQLSRSETADLMQRVCAPQSEYFLRCQRAALADDADAATYALYALMANVTTLDAARLGAVINELRDQKCSPRILASLNIIHHYLTNGTDYDEKLKAIVKAADGAYINLRGANIVANFFECDLSYADLRESGFFCLVSGASLQGANLSDARFDNRTIFRKTNTTGMIVDRLQIGEGFVFESEVDPVTGIETLEVPELASVIAAQNDKKDESNRPGGCNVM